MPRLTVVIRPPYWDRLLHYIGLFLIVYGLLNFLPVAVAVIYGEYIYVSWFVLSSGLLAGAGYVLSRVFPSGELDYREAAIAAALIFIIPGFALAPAFMLAGYSFLDGLFEAVSGITTTGLSMYSVGELPYTLHFARALYQWMGGLGIAVFTLTLLIRPGTAAHMLYAAHFGREKLRPTAASTARLIASIYIGFTVADILIYLALGDTLFGAVVHSFTTVSTGGFSVYSSMPFPLSLGTIVMMFIAAQPIAYTYLLFRHRRPRNLLLDPQLLSMLLFSTAAALIIWGTGGAGLYDSFYAAVSAVTTTGYSTMDLSRIGDAGKYVLSILMILGAAIGSTGGGLKQYRVILVLKEMKRMLVRVMAPGGTVLGIRYRGRKVAPEEVSWAYFLTALYLVVLTVSTLAFLVYGYSLADSLFEASSALATTGLSVGISSRSLPWLLKVVLIMDMWMGRVEIVPVLILFNPGNIGFPQER